MGKNRVGSVLNQTSVSQHFLPFQLEGCAAGRPAQEAVLSWDPAGHRGPFPKLEELQGCCCPRVGRLTWSMDLIPRARSSM